MPRAAKSKKRAHRPIGFAQTDARILPSLFFSSPHSHYAQIKGHTQQRTVKLRRLLLCTAITALGKFVNTGRSILDPGSLTQAHQLAMTKTGVSAKDK